MNDEDDLKERTFVGIRRTSEDKLTYKLIIADAINQCRRTMGTFSFKDSVDGLEKIIKFDIPGYQLKTQIQEIKDTLNYEMKQMEKEKEKKLTPSQFNKRAYQAKWRILRNKIYWETYYERLIQLLAKENLCLETEKYVAVHDST